MPNKLISYNPRFYRDRAEEMRRMAELLSDPDAKRKMLGVAESYEKLAKQAEHVEDVLADSASE
jgi:hypothetical protein